MSKRTLVLAALTLTALAAASPVRRAGPPPNGTLRDLAFLTGAWEFRTGERSTEEQWTHPAGGVMLGLGRVVTLGAETSRTLSFEFMKLEETDEGVTFTAWPQGKAGTTFSLVSIESGRATFENAENDFPARITYERVGETELKARIEGKIEGRKAVEDFAYRRVAIHPAPQPAPR